MELKIKYNKLQDKLQKLMQIKSDYIRMLNSESDEIMSNFYVSEINSLDAEISAISYDINIMEMDINFQKALA